VAASLLVKKYSIALWKIKWPRSHRQLDGMFLAAAKFQKFEPECVIKIFL